MNDLENKNEGQNLGTDDIRSSEEENMVFDETPKADINLEVFESESMNESGILPEEDEGDAGVKKDKARKNVLKEIGEWVILIVVAFLIASFIQSELFALTEVNMTSMKNTLEPGDRLIMNKLSYTFEEPQKGDIIIFLRDEPVNGFMGRAQIYMTDILKKLHGDFRRNRLIKRVIGVPGDEIEIIGNVLYINGSAQTDESYARVDPVKNVVANGELQKLVVPEGKLFVMGDNRGESLDSRSFGVIDLGWVEGKAVFRILPIGKTGGID